jgi:hypothetical protein
MFKVFKYEFDYPYGSGQGIVCAENEDKAKEIIKKFDDMYKKSLEFYDGKITLEEIEIKENLLFSFSWAE